MEELSARVLEFAGVADTHTAVWYLADDPKLPGNVKDFMEDAMRRRLKIGVAPISLVELIYLVEKKRLAPAALADLIVALRDPEHVLGEAPFHSGVAISMQSIAREEIPDMPDRIIAATAKYLDVPLLSRDGRIRASSIRTIWQRPSIGPQRPM